MREQILKAMEEKGITQADLVRQTGILQHRLSEYLNGKRDMTGGNLGRILEALGLELRPHGRKAKG